MKSVKLDKIKDINSGIKALLGPNAQEVVHTFEVVALDYKVNDYNSPKLLLTPTKLFFAHDDLLEMYELTSLEINITGTPKFTLWEQFLEGNYTYSAENEVQLRILKTDEVQTRLTIAEPNEVSKEFLIRKGPAVQKSFKTWAMGRIILNAKLGAAENKILNEMLDGYFSVLNQRTVASFIGSFLIYLVLKVISLRFLPDFVNTGLDIAFGAVLLFMAWWLYSSATNNLNRYKNVYLSYKA